MKALLIIDMQVGVLASPRYRVAEVIDRINRLSTGMRRAGLPVVFVQHDGPSEDGLLPHTPGWEIIPELTRLESDTVVRKTACDGFCRTELDATLKRLGADELIFCGCATDFCVDSTLKVAANHGYDILVASDAHTTGSKPHADAATVIAQHNFVWENFIMPQGSSIRVMDTDGVLAEIA